MPIDKAFRLLIVDDEIPAVQVIKCAVDWKALGVTSIYAAYDVAQAKKAFRNHSIDVMLCDIEMPQGNGLELLEWVGVHYPKTVSVIMTCHADFSYAKKAIKLGSLDYLLKPIPNDELENVVRKALDKIVTETKLLEYEKTGKLWLQHQPMLIERFWVDVMEQRIPPVEEEIKRNAEARNIDLDMAHTYLPLLIKVRGWHEEMSARDEKLMEFALKNSAEDMIIKKDRNGFVAEYGKGTLVCLLYMSQFESFDLEILKKDCEEYIAACNRYFCCDLCCYPGNVVYSHELAEMIDELNERDRNNVSHVNKVVSRHHKMLNDHGRYNLPDTTLWQKMLEEGSAAKLKDEVGSYLRGLQEKEELNEKFLYQFQQDLMQIIHAYLKQRGIPAHQLFLDSVSNELITRAIRSVDNMIKWAGHDIEKAVGFSAALEKSQSVVEQARHFIGLNIDQELTCEDISKQVHFNPDHLTRVFKKETGLTISEYIASERLKLAKGLLSKSDIPVTAVALQAGYKSLSHFSTMFRKMTGKNPLEYRQDNLNTTKSPNLK
ncbi:MAG: helix-turn-helix domain-containing protein [Clostridiales bacterium]|nr:helix-turn-helix domain-containing protein [Clostridiales bacterium]